jgi:hypothetical protein
MVTLVMALVASLWQATHVITVPMGAALSTLLAAVPSIPRKS